MAKQREPIDFNAYGMRAPGSYLDLEDLLGTMNEAEDAARMLLAETKQSIRPEKPAAPAPEPIPEKEEKAEEKPDLDTLLKELDELVGLEKVKENVKSLMNLVKVRKLRQEKDLPVPPMSLHLVFMGNPGTGKTTVARLIAKLYAAIGVLSKGQLVEVDRSGLVAGYVGQTAIKTGEAIQKALGGVLFVDEAYALTPQDAGGNDFGREAVEAILKAMEDHRDDLVVIVAGYEELMEQFISSNPGLESRFNRYFLFEDYNGQELYEIFRKMCEKNGYAPDDEAAEAAKKLLQDKYEQRDENFGNARDVRNLFENVITVHSNRLASMEAPEKEDLMHVTAEDIEKASLM